MTRRALLLASAAVPLAAIPSEPFDGWYGAVDDHRGSITITIPASRCWNDLLNARGVWANNVRDGL